MRNKVLLWIFGLILTMPVYNKYWAPYDEGITVVAAQMLVSGKVPYKDFFIIMYPPGQVYVLAAIFKLFSSPLIAARIYTVLVSVATSALVFFISRRLTKNLGVSLFSYLVVLTSLSPRLGAIPAPIWPGMLFGIFSIYLFMLYLKDAKIYKLIAAGISSGIAIAFRHDIGVFTFLSILIPLIPQSFAKRSFSKIIIFSLGTILFTLPWVIYFIAVTASKDIFRSLILFPFIHQRTASIPFPMPCLDPSMIFHKSLHFINVNQYYIPILAYTYIIINLFVKWLGRSWDETRDLSLLSILLFGIFTFNQVRIRPDTPHLLTVIAPAIMLSGFILRDTFYGTVDRLLGRVLKYTVAIIISTFLVLLLVKNIDKYLKNTYIKVYRKEIISTVFGKESIYIPREEREDVVNTVKFIKDNTKVSDKIYVGNTAHWKDDFGGSIIIYYLSDRVPAVKYYELAPGLVTDAKVQEEIKESLGSSSIELIVLQDVDTEGLKKELVSKDKFILDDFIQHNYRPTAKFGKYNIYRKI